jgi:hypothetical protein
MVLLNPWPRTAAHRFLKRHRRKLKNSASRNVRKPQWCLAQCGRGRRAQKTAQRGEYANRVGAEHVSDPKGK